MSKEIKDFCLSGTCEKLEQLQAELEKTCKWTPVESYDGEYYWETECGKSFFVDEGTPADNEMNFCAYCGGKLIVQALKGR